MEEKKWMFYITREGILDENKVRIQNFIWEYVNWCNDLIATREVVGPN